MYPAEHFLKLMDEMPDLGLVDRGVKEVAADRLRALDWPYAQSRDDPSWKNWNDDLDCRMKPTPLDTLMCIMIERIGNDIMNLRPKLMVRDYHRAGHDLIDCLSGDEQPENENYQANPSPPGLSPVKTAPNTLRNHPAESASIHSGSKNPSASHETEATPGRVLGTAPDSRRKATSTAANNALGSGDPEMAHGTASGTSREATLMTTGSSSGSNVSAAVHGIKRQGSTLSNLKRKKGKMPKGATTLEPLSESLNIADDKDATLERQRKEMCVWDKKRKVLEREREAALKEVERQFRQKIEALDMPFVGKASLHQGGSYGSDDH